MKGIQILLTGIALAVGLAFTIFAALAWAIGYWVGAVVAVIAALYVNTAIVWAWRAQP